MQTPLQAILIDKEQADNSTTPLRLALFNEDGSQKTVASTAEAQADSEAESVGELVTDFNALLAKLRAAGVLAED